MKNKTFTLILSLLLLSLTAFGREYEVRRQIHKDFKVGNNARLQIENRYGNIVIVEGRKNEIRFNIEIIGRGEKERIAEAMADRASIDFSKSGNSVYARTEFSGRESFRCNNCGTTVNYTVTVPSSVYMYLINKYGHIRLNDVKQNFKAELKYGNLSANTLQGNDNEIIMKYGNIEIGQVRNLKLDIAYASSISFTTVENLDLISSYSKMNADRIDNCTLSSKYDKYNITSLGRMTVTSSYTDFNIGDLQKTFDASNLRYCKVRIDRVSYNFNSIFISASYTPIRIGVTQQHNFRARLSTRYGNLRTKGLKFSEVSFDDTDHYSKRIEGIVGHSSNPKAQIEITDSYADIILNQ